MAATSTLKLVLDDKEYEASLKSAKQGMQALQQSLEVAGKSFSDVDKAIVDYAKELGKMDTVAKSAKGRINEMSSAFVELGQIYNKMTDEEKNSPVGKALSDSLEELRKRTINAKNELEGLNRQLSPVRQEASNTASVFDILKNKFAITLDAAQMFNMAIKAGEAVLNTFRSAIESTEAGHDKLARVTAVTDSITNQFLRSLANADFSNFLSGLDDIARKAIEAYNALDEFESYAARFNPYQQAQETQIQTKMMEARAAKAQGDKERAERLNDEAKQLINELEASTKAYGQKQTDAGYSVIKNLMGTVDISNEQIAWFANPNNWEEAKKNADAFQKKMEEIDKLGQSSITATSYDVSTRSANRRRIAQIEASITEMERQAYTMLNLRDSGESDEARQLKEALSNIYGNILADSRIANLRARAERMEGTIAASVGGGGGGGSRKTVVAKVNEAVLAPQNSIAGLTEDLRYLQQEQQKATNTDEWRTYQEAIRAVNDEIKILKGELNGPMGLASASGTSISGAINKQVSDWEKQMGKKLSQGINTGKVSADGETKSISKTMSEVSSNMQTIVSGLETLGVDIPEGFSSVLKGMTAVASILSGISALVTILTAIQGTKAVPVIGWALARGGVVRAAGGYPVPGNNFSGDMVPALLNSGETVLNRAQTGLIASALQENRMSSMRLEATVSGEQIRFVLNNNGRRTGRGEYVTTRFGSM